MKLYKGGQLNNQNPAPRVRPLIAARSCDTIEQPPEPQRWHAIAPWPRWSVALLIGAACAASFALGVLVASGGTQP